MQLWGVHIHYTKKELAGMRQIYEREKRRLVVLPLNQRMTLKAQRRPEPVVMAIWQSGARMRLLYTNQSPLHTAS